MTVTEEEPRLTPEAHAKLYGTAQTIHQVTAVSSAFNRPVTDQFAEEYQRGWNDCKAMILKALGA